MLKLILDMQKRKHEKKGNAKCIKDSKKKCTCVKASEGLCHLMLSFCK